MLYFREQYRARRFRVTFEGDLSESFLKISLCQNQIAERKILGTHDESSHTETDLSNIRCCKHLPMADLATYGCKKW